MSDVSSNVGGTPDSPFDKLAQPEGSDPLASSTPPPFPAASTEAGSSSPLASEAPAPSSSDSTTSPTSDPNPADVTVTSPGFSPPLSPSDVTTPIESSSPAPSSDSAGSTLPDTEPSSTASDPAASPDDSPDAAPADPPLPDGANTGSGPAAPGVSGDPTGDPAVESPVTTDFNREGTTADTAGTSIDKPADVPEGHAVIGVNPADGRPIVTDPNYHDAGPDASRIGTDLNAKALAADPNATEAERATGERTLTGTPDMGVVDAAFVGMAPAVEYRYRRGLRVLRMDRPFSAGGTTGGPGDLLAEDDTGKRFVLSQAELDEHFVMV